jgi:hypothetical protein
MKNDPENHPGKDKNSTAAAAIFWAPHITKQDE